MPLQDLAVGMRNTLSTIRNANSSTLTRVGSNAVSKADLRFPKEDQDDYLGKITFIAKQEQYRSLTEAGINALKNARTAVEESVEGVIAGGTGNNESARAITEQSTLSSRLDTKGATPSSASGVGFSAGQIDPALARAATGSNRAEYIEGIGWGKSHNEASPTASSTVTSGSAVKTTTTSSPSSNVRRKADQAAIKTFTGQDDDVMTFNSYKPTYTTTGQVQLYLPSTLQFQDTVEYANTDLGIKGTAAAAALRSGGGLVGAAVEGLKKVFDLEGVYNMVKKGMQDEGAQVLALRMASFSPEIQGAIETETGITLNPNRRSALRGVGVRRFRFTFRLLPTSPDEAREITEIIKFFRREMYPETSHSSLALKYPSKFEIRMQYGGKNVATGILPCFLENIDVVYNPNSMAFHDDGEFQQTDITLSFIEERALTKKDIRDGY